MGFNEFIFSYAIFSSKFTPMRRARPSMSLTRTCWVKTMQIADASTGVRCFQDMVAMRDGVRLNTFIYLPGEVKPSYPVIV